MRLRHLRDVYRGQDIYIIGSGPSANLFPFEFLEDKICLSLNDAYKMNRAIGPCCLMHHQVYAHSGNNANTPYHENFVSMKYPVVKGFGRDRAEEVDWDHPHFYYYDWSHDIDQIWEQTKTTDTLYYVAEGCALHAALQLAWIMGARNIFTIGCDSRNLGGRHYAKFDKNGFRDDEVLKRGLSRNYDAYVYGTTIIQEFLRRKGVNTINLSTIVGYHMVDFQFDVQAGKTPLQDVIDAGLQLVGRNSEGVL